MKYWKTEVKPIIVINSRKLNPLVFKKHPTVLEDLDMCDYSVRGSEHLFAVKCMTIDGLAHSCGKNRQVFERELSRMGHPFRRLLIIGTEEHIIRGNYESRMSPESLLGSVRSFEMRYNIPLVFEMDRGMAANRIEGWAYKHVYELRKNSNLVSSETNESKPRKTTARRRRATKAKIPEPSTCFR